MIKVKNAEKSFDGFKALNNLNLNVKKGSIYGLVGTNGAGKTTVIKHITGVLRLDSGEILIDGQNVYDNRSIKEKTGYIPDDLYFFATYNLREMAAIYKKLYPNWSEERFEEMLGVFKLDAKRKLSKFSKGMQKQAAFILIMSTMPEYLILDEPIDGLDPVVRKLVWKYIVDDVADREMTVLVSSHNLRELEGICDSIGILSKGSMLLERDLDDLKSDVFKVQVAFEEGSAPEDPYEDLSVLHREKRGSVDLIIVRNKREVVEKAIRKYNPLVFDILPLTLEEIFIYELGGADNEIKGIIF
ncbi:MAG: ABC transporter ATP-binding protein [Clostridia bacterium]|nr:ABC transporter ATP-binding protein [Clostridia bacterium]